MVTGRQEKVGSKKEKPQTSVSAVPIKQLSEAFAAALKSNSKNVRPMIRQAIKDGAPVNADKSINLIDFTAWILSKTK